MRGGRVLHRPIVGLLRALGVVAARPHVVRWMVWAVAALVALACWAAPGDTLAANFLVTVPSDLPDPNLADARCDVDNNPVDGDQCTLRAAIQQANALGGGPHTITLPPGAYTLTRRGAADDNALNGDLDVTANITIAGFFAPATFIQACDPIATPDCDGIDRVFDVQPGGTLTVIGVTVRKGNTSDDGGGIRAAGSLSLTNVVLDGNVGHNGGGLSTASGTTVTVTNAAVINNHATLEGGGISNSSEALSLGNVTVSANTAADAGGGLFQIGNAAVMTLTNVTLVNNGSAHGGAGIEASFGHVTLGSSIIANNALTSGLLNNCGGLRYTSQGFNLILPATSTHCQLEAATNDLLDADPKLGPLRANGGQVPTHALLPGSAAIDAGNPATPLDGQNGHCAAKDARGLNRPADGNLAGGPECDIGAYEVAHFTVNTTADRDDVTPGDLACTTSVAGECSLRAAIREANAEGGAAIFLPGTATPYSLTRRGDDDTAQNGDLDILGGVAIAGIVPSAVIVEGCDTSLDPSCTGIDRVFDVQPGGSLALSGVTVRKGDANGSGGGIRNLGTLALTLAVVDSNHASSLGGGLYSDGVAPIATLSNVTVMNNRADNFGGGIENINGTLLLTNVTVSDNVSGSFGGGLRQSGLASSNAVLNNVTIANNTSPGAGAGISIGAGTLSLSNTIVANNSSASGTSNCGGSVTPSSQGFNLVFPGGGCGLDAAFNDVLNRDPMLGLLTLHGSGVLTRDLLPGSAAIDAGNPASPRDGQGGRCAATDGRGASRQDGDGDGTVRCDIGAYELFRQFSDLTVTLTDHVETAGTSSTLIYDLRVAHVDGETVPNIHLVATFPASLTNVSWSCDGSQGSTCQPSAGTGNIDGIIKLEPGVSVSYRVTATVAAGTPPGTSVAATATITPPVGISDPNAANNSATDSFIFGSCSGRPAMGVSVQSNGAGRLLVMLTARRSSAQFDNTVRAVQLGTLRNAAVDVPPQPGVAAPQIGLGSGAQVNLSGPVQSLQFVVRRLAPGAFTVPLTATDNCGPWQTFAGGGTAVP